MFISMFKIARRSGVFWVTCKEIESVDKDVSDQEIFCTVKAHKLHRK